MRTFRTLLLSIVLGSGLAACASYPERDVVQGGEQGALAFTDAPPGAIVFVDNIAAGEAARFDGRNLVLEIAPGRHLVRVQNAGTVLLEREVFVGRGAVVTLDVQ